MSLLILTLLFLAFALQMGRFSLPAGKLCRQIVGVILSIRLMVNRLRCECIDAVYQLSSAFCRTLGMLVPAREFAERYELQLSKRSSRKSAVRHFSMQSSLSHWGVSR
jgi:hypothetical protein